MCCVIVCEIPEIPEILDLNGAKHVIEVSDLLFPQLSRWSTRAPPRKLETFGVVRIWGCFKQAVRNILVPILWHRYHILPVAEVYHKKKL